MSAGVDRRRDGSRRTVAAELPDNPTCHQCGRHCYSFGWPMYEKVINVCGRCATGPAAEWWRKRREARRGQAVD